MEIEIEILIDRTTADLLAAYKKLLEKDTVMHLTYSDIIKAALILYAIDHPLNKKKLSIFLWSICSVVQFLGKEPVSTWGYADRQ